MIRHTLTFHSPLPVANARGLLIGWLQSIGYRLTSPAFLSSIEASRGSFMGNGGSLNAQRWKATIYATFEPAESGCEVTLEWRIATFGQVVTKVDIAFWRNEVFQTANAARGVAQDPKILRKMGLKAQNGNTWRALVFTAALVLPFFGFVFPFWTIWFTIFFILVLGVPIYWGFRMPRTLGETPLPPIGPPAPPPIA